MVQLLFGWVRETGVVVMGLGRSAGLLVGVLALLDGVWRHRLAALCLTARADWICCGGSSGGITAHRGMTRRDLDGLTANFKWLGYP